MHHPRVRRGPDTRTECAARPQKKIVGGAVQARGLAVASSLPSCSVSGVPLHRREACSTHSSRWCFSRPSTHLLSCSASAIRAPYPPPTSHIESSASFLEPRLRRALYNTNTPPRSPSDGSRLDARDRSCTPEFSSGSLRLPAPRGRPLADSPRARRCNRPGATGGVLVRAGTCFHQPRGS